MIGFTPRLLEPAKDVCSLVVYLRHESGMSATII